MAQMLVDALGERGFDAFLDKTDIAPGEPWKERLGGLIVAGDAVVFVISHDSVASSVCAWEPSRGVSPMPTRRQHSVGSTGCS